MRGTLFVKGLMKINICLRHLRAVLKVTQVTATYVTAQLDASGFL